MPGSLLLVSATAFLTMLGLGVLFPVIGLFARSLGFSDLQVGVLIASYAAMSFFFAPQWGRFSERHGRKPAILIGLAGFSLGFILFGLAQTYPQFLGARILGGLFAAATIPAIFAYVADVSTPEKRSVSMGMVGASIGLGVVMGPVFGGVLSKYYGFRTPFFAAAGVGLTTLVLVAWRLPESINATVRAEIEARRAARLASGQTMAQVARTLWPYLSYSFVFQAAKMGFESTLAFVIADRFFAGATPVELEQVPMQVGSLLFGVGFIAILVQGGGIRVLTRFFSDKALLLWGTGLTAVGVAGLGFSTTWPLLYVSGGVLGLGYALAAPTFMALLSLAEASQGIQGEVQGLNSGAQSLGRVVGPVVFLGLYGSGIELTYGVAAGLCVVALALLRGVGRSTGTPTPQGQATPR